MQGLVDSKHLLIANTVKGVIIWETTHTVLLRYRLYI